LRLERPLLLFPELDIIPHPETLRLICSPIFIQDALRRKVNIFGDDSVRHCEVKISYEDVATSE
jgi:hypothetical protein